MDVLSYIQHRTDTIVSTQPMSFANFCDCFQGGKLSSLVYYRSHSTFVFANKNSSKGGSNVMTRVLRIEGLEDQESRMSTRATSQAQDETWFWLQDWESRSQTRFKRVAAWEGALGDNPATCTVCMQGGALYESMVGRRWAHTSTQVSWSSQWYQSLG